MTDYDKQTNDELREELEARGLPVSGNKDELVVRLEKDDDPEESADESVDEEESADDADDTPLTSDKGAPGRMQVVQEDGWTVQRGSWRKGSGE